MGRKLRHLLMFLLIILKEPNMPEAGCSCKPGAICTLPRCDCTNKGLTSIPRNLPTFFYRLDLARNQITKIQPGVFSNLTQLIDLTLSFNQITMIQPTAFSSLPQLQALDLSSNQITLIKPGTFINLLRLGRLILNSNNITMIQEGTFVNLPLIQILYLYNNHISMIQAGAFANLPQLQLLDLRNNMMSAISPLAFGLFSSKLAITLIGNPWQCDCKMAPFGLDSTEFPSFKDQIICAQPTKFLGKKLTDVNPEELVCIEPTIPALPVDVTLTSNGYNGATSGTTTGPAGEKNKPRTTKASPLQTTSDKPETGLALIGTIILTIWCKRRSKNPPPDPSSGPNPNIALRNLNMAGQIASMQSSLYKVVGQSQTITESSPNNTASVEASDHAVVVTSGNDQTVQDESQAITDDETVYVQSDGNMYIKDYPSNRTL
ncbi:uncharacterized protein LOC144883558 [Branchiostoma floridae x Branchiostoma japonicum]